MGFGGNEHLPRLFRVETARGESYEVGGRTMTPEARIVSFGKARGTVGRRGISGWMFGLSRVSPLAIVEDTDAGARRIKIVDATSNALAAMFAVAVAIILFLSTARWVARRVRERGICGPRT
jgi:hypothetical protein